MKYLRARVLGCSQRYKLQGAWVVVVLLRSWAPVPKRLPVPAGDPLQCGAWVGQCALYIVIMIFEKSVVFIVLLILQWKKVCLLPLLRQHPASPPAPAPACSFLF